MKLLHILSAAACIVLTALAASGRQPMTLPYAAGNYRLYPVDSIRSLTPAPEGYRPFHIEHYGRHGSRWHLGDARYSYPVEVLEMARRNNALTPLGESTLAEIKEWKERSVKRDGELTQAGAEQHRGIARRMAVNFPEVFAPGTHVDARSTVVIRCILSMLNGVAELEKAYNDLYVTTDASYADMYYMNNFDSDTAKNNAVERVRPLLKQFQDTHRGNGEFASKLISDPSLIKDSVDVGLFNDNIFDIAVNSVSHGPQSALIDLFTEDEIDASWQRKNASWFIMTGNSRLTDNKAPLSQAPLLRNIIESADTAVASPLTSVNLRYGHDSCVLPLAVLMNINGYGREINDLEQLADQWNSAEIIPMAANIQLIFYRRDKSGNPDDILVKVLLNEREATLPLTQPAEGFYRWSDLRDYWSKKIN